MKSINIGLVGAGYAAWLHGCAYEKVGKIPHRVAAIADIDEERAAGIARQFGIGRITSDYQELLEDPEIDVIDIVTPPMLHPEMIRNALRAGKHVICEKPLTGYFGAPQDPKPIGKMVPKPQMLRHVLAEMDELRREIGKAPGKFMYAENFVYCPPVQMAAEMIRKRRSRILFMQGEESLKGSSSALAGRWDGTGGGSLVRVGCHPLSAMLWLKRQEAQTRGTDIQIRSVTADVGTVTPSLTEEEHAYIDIRPQDVEDISTVTITFSDGSKALVIASDVCLGGARNYVQVYCHDANYTCNMTPADIFQSYLPDEKAVEEMDLGFGLSTKAGWNKPFAADDVIRGYVGEFQDFLECIAEDRAPQSDFELAYDTVKVMYGAYAAAEMERKLYF